MMNCMYKKQYASSHDNVQVGRQGHVRTMHDNERCIRTACKQANYMYDKDKLCN
jgi:hypothetical protein